MKRLSIAVAAVIAAGNAYAVDTQNARALGQGGTSVVAGNYGSASVNPAMASVLSDSDNFGFRINAGAEASDEDDFLDSLDQTQDEIDLLQQKIDNSSAAPGDETAVLDAIQDLEGKVVEINAGTDLQVAIPSQYIGAALFVKSDIRAALDFEDNTPAGLDFSDFSGSTDVEDVIDSEVQVSGYGITDVGVALSHRYNGLGIGDLIVGVSPKFQRIDLISKTENVSDFDTGDIRDDVTEDTGFNADLGAIYMLGENRQYRVGATVRNVVPRSVEGASGETFDLEPQASLAIGYDNGWIATSIEADATDSPSYGQAKAVKFARFGLELDAYKWAQFRVGVRHDLNGVKEDVMTAGIGLSPMDVINVDLAGIYGKNNTYGAAVQIGARF